MKTTWTTLSVALAVSLLAVEAQAAGFARNSRSTGSVRTNFSTGYNFHQGNLSSLKSSGQLLVKHNGPSGPTKLGPLNTANKFNTGLAQIYGSVGSNTAETGGVAMLEHAKDSIQTAASNISGVGTMMSQSKKTVERKVNGR